MTGLTPTSGSGLPFRPGTFSTLAEGLDYAAGGAAGFNFFSPRGELQEILPYRDLREQASELASRLAGGLSRGERVALLAETSAEFAVAFFACQYAGLIPVPLPLCVNIGGHEPYVRRLRALLAAADVRLVLGPADLVATLTEAARGTAAKVGMATWGRPP
jgi:fatty-acyl-CoA synthase